MKNHRKFVAALLLGAAVFLSGGAAVREVPSPLSVSVRDTADCLQQAFPGGAGKDFAGLTGKEVLEKLRFPVKGVYVMLEYDTYKKIYVVDRLVLVFRAPENALAAAVSEEGDYGVCLVPDWTQFDRVYPLALSRVANYYRAWDGEMRDLLADLVLEKAFFCRYSAGE